MMMQDEMKLRDDEIQGNTGWAVMLAKRQILRVTGQSCVSVVCFNAGDLTERFDQARTKVYNMRLWITTGEQLFSKLNNPMMTVVADQFAGIGRHDLQYGMCGSCAGNLGGVLERWGIARHQIPMPLNLFRHTEIDTDTGAIRPLPIRPRVPTVVELRAEMGLVVAVSVCPDLEAPGAGRGARATILAAT